MRPSPLTPPTPPAGRFPDLVAMLTRAGFTLHDAEDAAQDAALVALRYARFGRDQFVTNPDAWLKTVAVRAAVKAARRRLPCDADAVSTAASRPTDDADRRDEDDAIRRAVSALPERLRDVVVFCALEGHTHEEAVRRFGVCAGAVGRRLRAARLALRAQLSPDFIICDGDGEILEKTALGSASSAALVDAG